MRSSSTKTKRVTILGSTGSIGVNALGVTETLRDRVRVVGLSAHSNVTKLIDQIKTHQPETVSVWSELDAKEIRSRKFRIRGKALRVLSGLEGLIELAESSESDFILSAVVGGIGLRPLLGAIRKGKTVALANKEALIMAGELVMREAKRHKATILPVDSEHSAIFQCLNGAAPAAIRRLVLTASGGPFYRYDGDLSSVSVEQALAHPTWKMGKKITIDSATLMNKGIETIEAAILFGLPIDQVDVIIHPQSIVHSMVDFVDGAVIAQLSWPDMCLPIQYAMTYPDRFPGRLAALDLAKTRSLDFFEPDFRRFPCLGLARDAARKGKTYPTVLNAADEIAVHAFLNGKIRFTEIPKVVEAVLSAHRPAAVNLSEVLNADAWARAVAKEKTE